MDKRNVDIVLVRMDKIGDLVVSLPVDEHPVFAGRKVQWFITKGLGFITNQSIPKRSALEFTRRFSPIQFLTMYRWLNQQQPQTIVLLHNPWWVSMAAWLAGVPERIGRLSQWHSFLFVNLPVTQKRSTSDRHESDFNFDLVEHGFMKLGVSQSPKLDAIKKTYLRLSPPNPFATLKAHNLKANGYRVVHPGMGGSALNWPAEHFRTLIEKFAKELPVIITGTKADRKYLEQLMSLEGAPNVLWLVEKLNTSSLLDILSQARSVVGPSTGVLHLAASLNTPAIGIYSPRKVEHPRRWGPRGRQVAHLLPEYSETETITPQIMNRIEPQDVYVTTIGIENHHINDQAQPSSQI